MRARLCTLASAALLAGCGDKAEGSGAGTVTLPAADDPFGEARDSGDVDYTFAPNAAAFGLQARVSGGELDAGEPGVLLISLVDRDRWDGSIDSYRDHCTISFDLAQATWNQGRVDNGWEVGAYTLKAGSSSTLLGEPCDWLDPETWGEEALAEVRDRAYTFGFKQSTGVFDEAVAPYQEELGFSSYLELRVDLGGSGTAVAPVVVFDSDSGGTVDVAAQGEMPDGVWVSLPGGRLGLEKL